MRKAFLCHGVIVANHFWLHLCIHENTRHILIPYGGVTSLKACFALQWRYYERDGLSNQRRLECLLNCLLRHRLKKTSKLRVTGLCEGNPLVTSGNVDSPTKGPVTWKMFAFEDVIMGNLFVILSGAILFDKEGTLVGVYGHSNSCHITFPTAWRR